MRTTTARLALLIALLGAVAAGCAETAEPIETRSLGRSIEEDDLAGVVAALARGADPNGASEYGAPLLIDAIYGGNLAIVEALLARGADPNRPDEAEETMPLVAACEYGTREMYRTLRSAGARAKAALLIQLALQSDSAELVDEVLADFPDAAMPEEWLGWVIHMRCEGSKRLWIEGLLASHGQPDQAELDSALISASLSLEPEIVALLLELGANARGGAGVPAVATGYRSAREERGPERGIADSLALLDALISAGADPNAGNYEGRTAIFIAVSQAETELIANLLARGANPDGTTPSSQRTTLIELVHARYDAFAAMIARENEEQAPAPRQPVIAAMLIGAGADPNAQDRLGRSALHHAAAEAVPALVERFLAAGADPKRRDREGQTPADLARSRLPRRPGDDDSAGKLMVAMTGLGRMIDARLIRYAEVLELLGEPLAATAF